MRVCLQLEQELGLLQRLRCCMLHGIFISNLNGFLSEPEPPRLVMYDECKVDIAANATRQSAHHWEIGAEKKAFRTR